MHVRASFHPSWTLTITLNLILSLILTFQPHGLQCSIYILTVVFTAQAISPYSTNKQQTDKVTDATECPIHASNYTARLDNKHTTGTCCSLPTDDGLDICLWYSTQLGVALKMFLEGDDWPQWIFLWTEAELAEQVRAVHLHILPRHSHLHHHQVIIISRVLSLPYLPYGWWRGTVVERRSLADELSLSCARPAADGWPLMWVSHPLQVSQLGQLSLSSFRGR